MTYDSDVYERALSKMREFNFISLDENGIYENLEPYLTSAESKFRRICVQPLVRSDVGIYSVELDSDEVEILALGVVANWLSAYAADSDKMRNALGTKDYSLFSPANLINAVENLREKYVSRFETEMNEYSFTHGDFFRKGKKV